MSEVEDTLLKMCIVTRYHQWSRWRSMAEFKLMSVRSRKSVLKMLGPLGGATLKAVAELGGIRSSHSMVSHGDSLKVMPTMPYTSGTGDTLAVAGDNGVGGSIRSLLATSLSWCGW